MKNETIWLKCKWTREHLSRGVLLRRSANYPVTHDLFPSGPWTGFYHYRPKGKHRMDLASAAGTRKTGSKTNLPSVLRHGIF